MIGKFSARDEDDSQELKYSLTENDQGRFQVFANGTLYKANDTDYEKQKTHFITAVVEDNGTPSKTVCILVAIVTSTECFSRFLSYHDNIFRVNLISPI